MSNRVDLFRFVSSHVFWCDDNVEHSEYESRCKKMLLNLSTEVEQCLLETFAYMMLTSIKANVSGESFNLTAVKCKPHVGEKRKPRQH